MCPQLGQTRFGYTVEAPIEWQELLELARYLDEQSNFDYLCLADSLVANGPLDAPKLEVWTALAAIAQATSRIRLGMAVSGNAYRHPALLAKMVTTIDHISNGRVELGIGAGWPGENRRFGIDFWKRRERIERLDEALDVIKLLWTADHPKYEGRHYTLNGPPFTPSNVQQPRPPILIGGGSDAMLRVIAKHADKVSPMIDGRAAMPKVSGYCAEIGRDANELVWTGGGHLFLNDDPAMQRRALEWAMQQYNQTEEETLRGALWGSAEDVRAAVQRQIDDGVQEVYVFQLPRVHMKSLVRFSDEVIPHFR
jgi:alkanesulfonate monooxygenase SsuD/methylene tetrahydromethanopterin reductase-like flavin-dependent oxidoreductase (luciferase family)